MYNRLCEGLKDRGRLIPSDEDFSSYIDSEKDYYTSIYQYDENHKKIFDEQGSVKGIRNVTTDLLVFDFDSDNVEKARTDTSTMIERLKKHGISTSAIDTYASGSKGFHIVIKTDQRFTPMEAKTIAMNLAKDLTTFDSVVYNPSRIFRVPNTKHPKSGLYKRQLSPTVIQTKGVEHINLVSKKPAALIKKTVAKMPRAILQMKTKTVKERPEPKTFMSEGLDLSQKPDYLSPWKYALSMGFFPEGTRHDAILILLSTYKNAKFKKEQAYRLVKAACEYQADRFAQSKFDKEEVWECVESVFDPSWTGGSYSEDNFPLKLQKYLTEDLQIPRREEEKAVESIVTVNEAFKDFNNYANSIDENIFKFGIKSLDDSLEVQLGHLVGVLAPPGVGKTSLAITILNNTSKDGHKSFFGSYDMYSNIVFQKLIMREFGMTSKQVFDTYRNENKDLVKKFQEKLNEEYGNVTFCFKVGQTVEELKSSINYQEQKIGEKIKLVVVDYLELVRTKSADPTQASMEAIQGLREIANEGRVVMVLLQPNKMSSTPNEPILSYSGAKGSSSIAQAVTSMITAHRPGLSSTNPEGDNFFSINVVKNRLGPLSCADFAWDGPTGRITELDDNQRAKLQEVRALKKLEKELKDDF